MRCVMGDLAELSQAQTEAIRAIVNEALEKRLGELPTKEDLEELAKANDISAIARILEHHGLIIKVDET